MTAAQQSPRAVVAGVAGYCLRAAPLRIGLLCLTASLLLSGCGMSPTGVSVSERSTGSLNGRGYYQVRRGDTLSEIAQRYGMNYRVLARYNGIRHPYTIHPGQKLYLRDRGRSSTGRSTSKRKASAKATKKKSATRSAKKAKPAVSKEAWIWPTSGQVIARYRTSGQVNKGINIAGQSGQSVKAARSGEVVYAGDGLKSYGLLVIIKHDDQFLSAYAYNRRAHVKEGDKVKKGQKIAQMGAKQGARAQLHFEIRRDGRPVDPMRWLPAR